MTRKSLKQTLSLVLLAGLSIQSSVAQYQLEHITSISIGDESAAEIVAFDNVHSYAWVLNSPEDAVDCYDMSDPSSAEKLGSFGIAEYGGGVNSVAVFDTLVAIAIEDTLKQQNGTLAIIGSKGRQLIKLVETGALPDMVTFNHAGNKILVACEGEPNDDYTNDPEGSITVVDLSNGAANATAKQVTFRQYNGMKALLLNNGVRISGPDASVAQDLEPEYISVTEDDATAYISLQENNAVAVLDLATDSIVDILPLGFKDHSTGRAHLTEYFINELIDLPSLGTGLKGDVKLGGFSGLWYNVAESSDGVHVFYAVPDRGPNLGPVKAAVDTGGTAALGNLRPFLTPDYASRIVKFTVNENTGAVTLNEDDQIFLTGANGETITGRGNIPGKDEVPVVPVSGDDTLNAKYHVDDMFYAELAYDSLAGDFEGVLIDKDGYFWLCDENRPSVYKFNPDGTLVNRFVAEGTSLLGAEAKPAGYYGTETLPESYSYRWANRGFEAIAYNPDEHIIYAFIQSPMYFPTKATKGNSDVIRILAIDANNGTPVGEYVYLLERVTQQGVASQITDKIGDAVFTGNGKMLVIERDSEKPGSASSKKYIYEINLKGATNVLDSVFARDASVAQTLEQMSADDLAAAGIKPVFKRKIVNLPSIGYLPSDKAEGIALLPDGKIAVLNDNDFGLNGAGVSDAIDLGIIHFDDANRILPSDKATTLLPQSFPTLGMYMPDAIASYSVHGINYFVTANEGDGREYGDYEDEAKGAKLDLDTVTYPNADDLQSNSKLGRIRCVLTDGWNDLDGDGFTDNIFTFGGRSFSIYDQYGNQVYDSGNEFDERALAKATGARETILDRADNKGCEPEALTIGKIDDKIIAFIGLERSSGIMMYDITDPHNAQYIDYINTFDFIAKNGDESPEGLTFVPAEKSPTGQPLLLAGHEVSGTLAVYNIGEKAVTADFAVASDLHYFSPSLLQQNGSAFQAYLAQDRKLIAESSAITRALVDQWLKEKPAFVIIPGDLTKDGAKVSHQELAVLFAELETAGIEVFVAPGNRDINNPHAVSYNGSETTPVDQVSAETFKTIYSDFGYSQAIAAEPTSLSYVAEPAEGFRIISIDACQYSNNGNSPETAGALSPEVFAWVLDQIAAANQAGDEVVAFMHHGIIEHYKGQSNVFPEYVVEDWKTKADELAAAGLRAMFTGHSHAQDIAKRTSKAGNIMYDIQTGSTVTYPCPYRSVAVVDGSILEIESKRIESINYNTGGKSFQHYAYDYLANGLPRLVTDMLTKQYGLDSAKASALEPAITRAYLAHYEGNESTIPDDDQALVTMLTETEDPVSIMLGKTIAAIWSDIAPNDWDVAIDLHEQGEPFRYTLQMLHASDLEGGVEAIGRAANFTAIIDKLEDEYHNSILLSAGDNYIPGPFFGAASDGTVQPVLRNVYADFYADSANTAQLRAASGRIDISIMNIAGFDASAIGNHEFDAGTTVMAENVASEYRADKDPAQLRWQGTQFPYLSANLNFSEDAHLADLYTNEILPNSAFKHLPKNFSENTVPAKIAPATILERGGELIGVVGATTQMVETISSTGGVSVKGGTGNAMQALADTLQPYIDQLTAMGVDKIIVVSHLQQIALEQELIGLLRDVDIIVAGGSDVLMAKDSDVLHQGHEKAMDYPLVTENANGQPAILVGQDGQYSYVGRLVVDFDKDGIIDPASIADESGAYASTIDVVESLWKDSTKAFKENTKGELVLRLVNAVNNIVVSQDANIFGKTAVYLQGERSKVRTEETNFGNISADANLWVAQQYDSEVMVSIKNGGGIRSAIGEVAEIEPGVYHYLPPQANALSGKQEGEISQLDIANSLRFNNKLTIVPLTAAGLLSVVEHGVAAWTETATPGQFCQVGGIRFSFDPSKDAGQRIYSMSVVNADGEIVDVVKKDGVAQGDMNRIIKTVTLDFLAGGGDTYPFADLVDPAQHTALTDVLTEDGYATFATAGSEQDALAEYLHAQFSQEAFTMAETAMADDERIQNLMYRDDNAVEQFTLQLLHASDLEGGVEAIGRAANFAAIVDTLEDEFDNTILLSAGDNYIPGPFFGAASDGATQSVLQNVYADLYADADNTTQLRAASGRIDISIMNILGFDASAIGNHEFDAGTTVMTENIGIEYRADKDPAQLRWLGTQFPYLSSNLDFSADDNLADLYTSEILMNTNYRAVPADIDANTFGKKIAPATIIERNGEKIGVVGATTQMVETISSTGGVVAKDGVGNDMDKLATVVQQYVDSLTTHGVDKIIVVTHLQQVALEQELIGKLSDVDIIIAGGSDVLMAKDSDVLHAGHEKAMEYPMITKTADGDPAILLAQDGQYTYLGRLVVEFDNNGFVDTTRISELSGAYASTDEVVAQLWGDNDAFAKNTKGELVQRLVTAVKDIVTAQDGTVFGKTAVYLEGDRSKVRTEETNFGNLSADANLWVAQQYDPAVMVSIKNGGGIRSSIGEIAEVEPGVYHYLPPQANELSGKQEGEISQLDIANSLRFNNSLTIVPLTAEGLKTAVEHGVAAWEEGATPGQFCQVGGMRFSYDPTQAAGSRIQTLVIVNAAGEIVDQVVKDGALLGDANRIIKTVTLNFLAAGGDNYPFAQLVDEAQHIQLTDVLTEDGSATFAGAGTEQDALAEYLNEKYATDAFAVAETDIANDRRIENLSKRSDEVITANDVIVVKVSSLTELRAMPQSDTVYILAANAVVSYNDIPNSTVYIQDADAGIAVLDADYTTGDSIHGLKGTLTNTHGMLQFVLVADVAEVVSSGNTVTAQTITADELEAHPTDYESELVRIADVKFTPNQTIAEDASYTASVGDKAVEFYNVFKVPDLMGDTIPYSANITGIVITVGGTAAIAPRMVDDLDVLLMVDPAQQGTPVSQQSNGCGVYPNPAKDQVFVTAPVGATVRITQIDGSVLATFSTEAPISEIAWLPHGTYYLSITTNAGTSVHLLVVE